MSFSFRMCFLKRPVVTDFDNLTTYILDILRLHLDKIIMLSITRGLCQDCWPKKVVNNALSLHRPAFHGNSTMAYAFLATCVSQLKNRVRSKTVFDKLSKLNPFQFSPGASCIDNTNRRGALNSSEGQRTK